MATTQRKRLGVRNKCLKPVKKVAITPYRDCKSLVLSSKTVAAESEKRKQKDDAVYCCSSPPAGNKAVNVRDLSFDSDINEEVMDLMDRMDSGVVSSTPHSSSSQTRRQSIDRTAAVPQLDFSTPIRPYKISNSLYRNGETQTPITSPSNTSKKSVSILQTPQHKTHLSLSQWGLPEKVLKLYLDKGVTNMFQWQADCLSLEGVLAGRNVIYSAPTSAGKTLIAELLLLKCVLEKHKKVIMILPFVSIVHEKVNYLASIFEPVGIKVGGFMGGHSPQGGLAAVDVAICTIEKANSLINHVLEDEVIDQLGMVIVDELHMVGDHHRGYLLELLLTKLQYVCQKYGSRGSADGKEEHNIGMVQLLGMSATLPNLPTLAKWLNAALYQTDFRPVPLQEMVKMGDTIYDYDFKVIRKLVTSEISTEEDEIAEICCEKIRNGHSVLIFCPTKAWCEKLAKALAQSPIFLNESVKIDKVGLDGVHEQLRRTQVGIDPVLANTLQNGIAFHHAGLTFDEREIIEGAFRQYSIRVLVATSTLSSGVNLPARLVIVRTPIFHQTLIDILTYKQMIGRAGRKGVDEKGESMLVCKPSEKSKVLSLLKCTPRPVQSCLGRASQVSIIKNFAPSKGSDLAALKRAVLEVVVNGMAMLESDILQYLECTLLYTELLETDKQKEDIASHTNSLLQRTLEFLREKDFVRERNSKEQENTSKEYYSSQFGMATVASGLAPDDALVVFDEFQKARKAFVLENELHIIYLVTPVYILDQWPAIDWYKFYYIWEKLPEDVLHVAKIVGVQESFIGKAMQSKPPERTQQQLQKLRIHRRFYTSLVLQDLVHEVPIRHVSHKYGASKGLLQSLQSAAGTFSGMVTVFCNKLGWTNLELLLSQFQSRLTFGIERELIDLVKISLLNGCRARVLYNAGYHNLAALATANPQEIEKVLRNAFPYKTKSDRESQLVVNWCAKLRKGMTESDAAKEIIQEAKTILCDELNIPESAFGIPVYQNTRTKENEQHDDKLCLRLNRKATNKNEKEQESTRTKQPRLALDYPFKGGQIKTPEQLHSARNNIISSNLAIETSTGTNQNNDMSLEQAINVSTENIQFRDSNASIDPFMDFSLNTLAQLDAMCEEDQPQDRNHQSLQPLESPIAPGPYHSEMEGKEQSVQIFDESISMICSTSFKDLSVLHSTTCSDSGLTVIDIAADEILLETFLEECNEQEIIAFSIATEHIIPTNGIGTSLIKPSNSSRGIPLPLSNDQVLGVAFSWGDMDTYYLSLCEAFDNGSSKKRGLDMSQIGNSPLVPLKDRIKLLESLFNPSNPKYYFVAHDIKKQVKLLMSACQIDIKCQLRDPNIADWLLDPDTREKTLNHMIMKYLPAQPKVADGVDGCETTLCSVACHSPFPYLRACAECVITEALMSSMSSLLKADNFMIAFDTVEMPIAVILAKMEVNGIGFSATGCEKLRDQLQCHLSDLEQEAYKHAGRMFALTSPEDISVVLFNELKLPSFQNDRGASKSLGSKKSTRRIQHLSTSKDILEKIKHLHPLPGVVLEWRRVSSTVSRTLFPLFKASVTHSNLESTRIHPSCLIHTATGRVSISEPNLQNVPKEYPVGLHKVSNSTQQTLLNSLLPEFEICGSQIEGMDMIKTVCMRNVFEPFPGGVFIAADYSQLELRLLAHLSQDTKLCHFLNQGGDAFRMIAGEWLSTEVSNISDVQRQQTKQMCYGMIYGIGAKALGEQMGVTEDEAHQFMDSFKLKYPQVKKFITKTINQCRDKGYIETILGRKRFLSHINSSDQHKRAHAERQAVNSTIQGSAADLVKTAMIKVEKKLQEVGLVTCLSNITSASVNPKTSPKNIALLVLQLHDELLYEVHANAVDEVVRIVKKEMEGALELSVSFPVKVTTGNSWGRLEPYKNY